MKKKVLKKMAKKMAKKAKVSKAKSNLKGKKVKRFQQSPKVDNAWSMTKNVKASNKKTASKKTAKKVKKAK